MTKLVPFALLATVATLAVIPASVFAAETNQQVRETASAIAAPASVAVTAGKMLYGPDGNRIASVYRVTSAGDVQIIIASRLVTVPASTLSEVNGKVATSLTKSEINHR
jgi:hypothetical protein